MAEQQQQPTTEIIQTSIKTLDKPYEPPVTKSRSSAGAPHATRKVITEAERVRREEEKAAEEASKNKELPWYAKAILGIITMAIGIWVCRKMRGFIEGWFYGSSESVATVSSNLPAAPPANIPALNGVSKTLWTKLKDTAETYNSS